MGAGAVLAAVSALALAPLGHVVLYVGGALVALGALAYPFRAEIAPPFRDAARRARDRRDTRERCSGRARAVTVALCLVALPVVSFLCAGHGVLALGAVPAMLVLSALAWLCWPPLRQLALTAPVDVPWRPRGTTARRSERSARGRWVGTACVVGATGSGSFVLAQLGLKGLISALGLIAVVTLMILIRNHSEFFTFLSVASLTFVLHKSFSAQDLQQSGGAISIYVTTFDALVLVLYGLWIHEGTFADDVRSALRRRILLVPLAGAILFLPSVLVAPSAAHSASELFRMGWMYLLFFYAAVRVRTRRHLWAALAGLAVFVAIEFTVVLLQWRTGGVLGLSFLGVPTTLTDRTTDVSELGRPFGTIIHPVFMGATMGSLGLLALSLAITLRRSLTKIAATICVALCGIPLYLSHDRAATVAGLIAAAYVVGVGLARGHIRPQTIGRFAIAALIVAIAFWPALHAKFSENFGTGHFWEEIASRLQLNGIALRMMSDHPFFGVGLNNFEVILPKYEAHRVIFFGNPVHNLYLLDFSETGLIGFIGFAVVAVGMFRAAVLAARSQDGLLGGFAVGTVAMMIFLGLEELLGFSLRQDVPLAVFWLLVGLTLACANIEDRDSFASDDQLLRPASASPPANRTPHRGGQEMAR